MSESVQQEIQQQSSSSKQQEESNQDVKITTAWEKSSKELINQHQNKFDVFKSMADQSGTIDESHFIIGGEQKSQIFKRFDADHDGKINQQEWNQGWNNLDVQVLETQHKVQIAQQKMQILDALESKVEPVLNISQRSQNQYYNVVDRLKNTSKLGDLTDLFNKKSPFHENEEYQESSNYEIRQKGNNRPLDQLLQQFKTPNKTDIFVETSSGNGSGKYLGSNKQTQKIGLFQGSASPGFNSSTLNNNNQYNSKIHQQMNINIDIKDKNRSNKRREELASYMGKLGLGGNESISKSQINIEQPNSNVFERMKVYVSNIGSQNTRNQSQPGLNDFVSDKSLSTTTFKQQLKQYRKDRGGEQSETQITKFSKPSNFLENPLLQDQSLKSFHLKLMHSQGALNNKYTRI
ncbi:unnamed protein product [Paramecium pentaurelia]|uniref:EF-hand domain-containing protein n=1 Tax=Paramecium pentaurelia TaxID=43138 RepID=A0A8S1TBX7_9CILI|nr:unnamed protein product [Paramecium pentaurelia]